MTACRFSLAPLGEPGKVIMIDRLRTPATGLAMTAKGVTASEEATIPCTMPEACLCSSGLIAYCM